VIRINKFDELSMYDLEGKWNDYIGAQKEIIAVLKSKGFFESGIVVNAETGMEIRITAKGVKETIGKGKRFQSLPRGVKEQKICSIRILPELIKSAYIIKDNVENYHEDKKYEFAYFVNNLTIDDVIHNVRIVIKKKIGSNHFYIHHIDTEKSSELLSPS